MINKKLPKLPRKKALLRKFPRFNLRSRFFLIGVGGVVLLLMVAGLVRALISSNFINVTIDNIHCVSSSELEILVNSEKINLALQEDALKNKLKKKYSCIESINKKWRPMSLELYVSGRKAVLSIREVKKTIIEPEMLSPEATASSQAAIPKPSPLLEYGETFLTDDTGLIFAKKDFQTSIPQIDWIGRELAVGQTFEPEDIKLITGITEFLKMQGYPYDSLTVEDGSLTVTGKGETDTGGKNLFIFSLSGDYTTQVTSLQLILQKAKMNSKSIQKVDLRFNKPVVVYTPDKKK